LSLIGYLMFAIGLIGLILSMGGLRLSILRWVEANPLVALLVKLGLIISGLIIMYTVRLEHE